MSAYAYYLDEYYVDAIFNLERYMNTYPKDSRMDYAQYLLAMCYFEQIVDEKKDLKPLIAAKEKFNILIKNYPNGDFAVDATFKISLLNNVMASKEMYIGRHYLKKEKWIPAINRFKNVINIYDDTTYVEEALHRLVEIYYYLGLKEESKKYANLLGYNYQSSIWYKNSYKLLNKNQEAEKNK